MDHMGPATHNVHLAREAFTRVCVRCQICCVRCSVYHLGLDASVVLRGLELDRFCFSIDDILLHRKGLKVWSNRVERSSEGAPRWSSRFLGREA